MLTVCVPARLGHITCVRISPKSGNSRSTLAPLSKIDALQDISEEITAVQALLNEIAALEQELRALAPELYGDLAGIEDARVIRGNITWGKRNQPTVFAAIVSTAVGAAIVGLAGLTPLALVGAVVTALLPPAGTAAVRSRMQSAPVRRFMTGLAEYVDKVVSAGSPDEASLYETEPFSPVEMARVFMAIRDNQQISADVVSRYLHDKRWQVQWALVLALVVMHRNSEYSLREDVYTNLLSDVLKSEKNSQVLTAAITGIDDSTPGFRDIALQKVLNSKWEAAPASAAVARLAQIGYGAGLFLVFRKHSKAGKDTADAAAAAAAVRGLAALAPDLEGFQDVTGKLYVKDSRVYDLLFPLCNSYAPYAPELKDAASTVVADALEHAQDSSFGFVPEFRVWIDRNKKPVIWNLDERLTAGLIGLYRRTGDAAGLNIVLEILMYHAASDKEGTQMRSLLEAVEAVDPLLRDRSLRMRLYDLQARKDTAPENKTLIQRLLLANIHSIDDAESAADLTWWGQRCLGLLHPAHKLFMDALLAKAVERNEQGRVFYAAFLQGIIGVDDEKLASYNNEGLERLCAMVEDVCSSTYPHTDSTVAERLLTVYRKMHTCIDVKERSQNSRVQARNRRKHIMVTVQPAGRARSRRQYFARGPLDPDQASALRNRLDSALVRCIGEQGQGPEFLAALAGNLGCMAGRRTVADAFILRSLQPGGITGAQAIIVDIARVNKGVFWRKSFPTRYEQTASEYLSRLARSPLMRDKGSCELVEDLLGLHRSKCDKPVKEAALRVLAELPVFDDETIGVVLTAAADTFEVYSGGVKNVYDGAQGLPGPMLSPRFSGPEDHGVALTAAELIGRTLRRLPEWSMRKELSQRKTIHGEGDGISVHAHSDFGPAITFSEDEIDGIVEWLAEKGFFDETGPGYYHGRRLVPLLDTIPVDMSEDQKTVLSWYIEYAPLYLARNIEGRATTNTSWTSVAEADPSHSGFRQGYNYAVKALLDYVETVQDVNKQDSLRTASLKALSAVPLLNCHKPDHLEELLDTARFYADQWGRIEDIVWGVMLAGRLHTHAVWFNGYFWYKGWESPLKIEKMSFETKNMFFSERDLPPYRLLRNTFDRLSTHRNPFDGTIWRPFTAETQRLTPAEAAANALAFNLQYQERCTETSDSIIEIALSYLSKNDPFWLEWAVRVLEMVDHSEVDMSSELKKINDWSLKHLDKDIQLRLIGFLISMAAKGKHLRIRRSACEALDAFDSTYFNAGHVEVMRSEIAAITERLTGDPKQDFEWTEMLALFTSIVSEREIRELSISA